MNTSTSVDNRVKGRPEAVENTTVLIILADSLVVLGSLFASFFIRFRYLDQIGVTEPGMTLGGNPK